MVHRRFATLCSLLLAACFGTDDCRFAQARIANDGVSCRVVTLLPFTAQSKGGLEDEGLMERHFRYQSPEQSRISFSYLAAAQLAMDHFNARDSSVCPELDSELAQNCQLQLDQHQVFDTNYVASTATRRLIESVTMASSSSCASEPPCAVVGPVGSHTARSVKTAASAMGSTQVYFGEEDDDLYATGNSGVGFMLTSMQRAQVMTGFLQRPGFERNYLVVSYTQSSQQLTNALEAVGPSKSLTVLSFLNEGPMAGQTMKEYKSKMLDDFKMTGFKTIFFNHADFFDLAAFAPLLQEKGMLTDEFLYIFSPEAFALDNLQATVGYYPPDSPLDRFLRGGMIFDRLDGFRRLEIEPAADKVDVFDEESTDGDAFLRSWQSLGADFVQRINDMQPLPQEDPSYTEIPNDYFQTTEPAQYSSYVYDSVMAIGLGGCKQLANSDAGLGNRRLQEEEGRDLHVEAISQVSFQGASGQVAFAEGTNVVDPVHATIVFNIRASNATREDGNGTAEATLLAEWTKAGGWKNFDGSTFVYRDGTNTAPSKKREFLETNYLSMSSRLFGCILLAVSWFLGLSGIVLVHVFRNDMAIKASQPFFLQLLSAGSVIMATSILTFSFDEGGGWSQRQLEVACIATPWFFFVGQLMVFSALFTKLWRLDCVLQLRRRAVTVLDVMAPLVIIFGLALVILIVWTIIDPFTWERELIQMIPAESYGQCESQHLWVWFGPLMGLIVIAELATAFFAMKTSDVPTGVNDTSSVMYTLAAHLQAWSIGVPILAVLGNTNADATFFGRALLIFVFSVSSTLLTVHTKVYQAYLARINPEPASAKRGRVRISGLQSPPSSMVGGASSYVRSSTDYSSRNGTDSQSLKIVNTRQSQSSVEKVAEDTSEENGSGSVQYDLVQYGSQSENNDENKIDPAQIDDQRMPRDINETEQNEPSEEENVDEFETEGLGLP